MSNPPGKPTFDEITSSSVVAIMPSLPSWALQMDLELFTGGAWRKVQGGRGLNGSERVRVAGLSSSTTYAFRVLAEGDTSEMTSGSATVTTLAAPSQPAPVLSIVANPGSIQPGGSSEIRWESTDATRVNIEGFGDQAASGSATIRPTQTVTLRATAYGPGGQDQEAVTITVAGTTPAPGPNQPPASQGPSSLERVGSCFTTFFDTGEIQDDCQAPLLVAGILVGLVVFKWWVWD